MRIRIPVAFLATSLFAFISASLLVYGCTATQATKAQDTLGKVETATQTVATVATNTPAPPVSDFITQIAILALAAEKLVGSYVIPAITTIAKNAGTSASNSSTAAVQGKTSTPNS